MLLYFLLLLPFILTCLHTLLCGQKTQNLNYLPKKKRKKRKKQWDEVAHAYNPSTLGGWSGWITRSRDRDHPGQHGETPSLLKIHKISWAWWRVPVIPGTQEAEAGELPDPRRRRLLWAELVPLHSSLGNKSETPSPKKKKGFRITYLDYKMLI